MDAGIGGKDVSGRKAMGERRLIRTDGKDPPVGLVLTFQIRRNIESKGRKIPDPVAASERNKGFYQKKLEGFTICCDWRGKPASSKVGCLGAVGVEKSATVLGR